ncbi:MAG: lipopolysaccharide heptosyltransferase II [Nitrospirae bacterium]|nr:lipopolysaccharide heptosyltransferase II [Nitrospirota bacterium]
MKFLIIKPSSIGDVIHALPFLKALKDTFPQSRIEWVISKNNEGIIRGNPMIDELIVFDKDSWKVPRKFFRTLKDIRNLIKTLRARNFDMVIDLQGLLRSGLMTFFTRSPLKIGFGHAREGSRFFYNKRVCVDPGLHAVDKNLTVARAIRQYAVSSMQYAEKAEFPLYIDKTAKENVKNLLGEIRENGYIVIVPSARWQTKRWPAEYFGMLISGLSIPCVITGSSADEKIAQEVMDASSGKGINLCNKTSLKELIALISGAKAVISNDSGPMQIGAALGIPVIALFGPTDPEKTGPYGWQTNKNLKVIRASASCSPCFKKKCKEPLCMSKISVEMVLEELKEYL